MNAHPIAIPATAALGSGDNRDQRALAIIVNEPIGNQSADARHEWETRKRLRATGDGVVDAAEVQASRRRLVAVETTEAQLTLGLQNNAVLAAVVALGVQMTAQMTAQATPRQNT
jgi:hypothetical protein